MPPPLDEVSGDESTGGSIPFNDAEEQQDMRSDVNANNGDEDEDDEEEGVYVVEKIVGHQWGPKGQLLLTTKWKGYDDEADLTNEPEENLMEGAKDLVEEYFRLQGGRPEKPGKPGRKRKSVGAGATKPKSEATAPKRQRRSQGPPSVAGSIASDDNPTWVPKNKNWENYVKEVDTIIRDADTAELIAYLHWENGRKTKVSLSTCYEKCPKKMLEFYEKHLVFKEA